MVPSEVIPISTPLLICAVLPLVALACVSHSMGLGLESPIAIGTVRSGIQLTVLGTILQPLFTYGTKHWWLVLAYVTFMLGLAAWEASSRSKYAYPYMSLSVFASFLLNIGVVTIFAFAFIIRPTPVWEPQYVIPIVGMLTGNCINGVALSLDAIMIAFVERYQEVEIYLSFGASPAEASARLIADSVRVGATPILNTMAVIGLISIPGMMTGQILGGSPVMEAARYQMLIIYLISVTAIGTIFCQTWLARWLAFEKSQMLNSTMFARRSRKFTLTDPLALFRRLTERQEKEPGLTVNSDMEPLVKATNGQSTPYSYSQTSPGIRKLHCVGPSNRVMLDIKDVSRSVPAGQERRVLFGKICTQIHSGDLVVIGGPSGAGKSQLTRVLGGLSPSDAGYMALNGHSVHEIGFCAWRCQVRYVSQYKIDIPSTPRRFIYCIASFGAFSGEPNMPCASEMLAEASRLAQDWGLDRSCLDQEWKELSGGEGQRVYLAIALASRPSVLLMDESTASLDDTAKRRVEATMLKVAQKGTAIVFVTHDADQIDRLQGMQWCPEKECDEHKPPSSVAA